MDSILTSIKKMLGPEFDDDSFDTDIIININTALMELTQIGVGPEDGYMIQDASNTWEEFLGYSTNANSPSPLTDTSSVVKMEAVKTCIYLKVKLVFDPPDNASHIESIKNQIDRLEWRLNIQAESTAKEG